MLYIAVPLSELPQLNAAYKTNVHAILSLNRQPGKATLISLHKGTATQRIKNGSFSTGEIREKHEKILERLSAVPTYELQYCELGDVIAQLDLLVDRV